ncbi:MAG: hypothetical protein ACOCWI_00085 [Bacillota bacterium]
MDLKKDKLQALKAIEKIDKKAQELYDISAFDIKDAKIKANDWYQEVIAVVKDLFYDSKEIIDSMNTIIMKEGRPTHGADIKKAFNIQTIDLEQEKNSLINKVKQIISFLFDAVNNSNN